MTISMPMVAMGSLGAVVLALGVLVWIRLNGYRRGGGSVPAAAGEFTTARYAPMARLLGNDDLEFLRQFAACRPKLVSRWERERRQIFRLYLREAASDFQRLHAEARLLVANAPAEHADLVGKLMLQQVRFWRTLAIIELRLTLGGLGFGKSGLGVDASRIVGLIEALRAEVGPSLSAPSF
jgi:hypothetical protein